MFAARHLSVVVFATALLAPQAQVPGVLTGSVRDTGNVPLPGVNVTLSTVPGRTAVTDSDGHYRFADVPPGTHTLTVRLPGFETAIDEAVVVGASAVTTIDFVLRVGCLGEVVYVYLGLESALREASTVAHIRIAESGPAQSCRVGGMCVCTEHQAEIGEAVVTDSADRPPASLRFLQDGAGRIPEAGQSGSERPYAPGEEYVAFLRWDETANRFVRIGGPTYMFPVHDGRVEFWPKEPGFSNGMPVQAFMRALRAASAAAR